MVLLKWTSKKTYLLIFFRIIWYTRMIKKDVSLRWLKWLYIYYYHYAVFNYSQKFKLRLTSSKLAGRYVISIFFMDTKMMCEIYKYYNVGIYIWIPYFTRYTVFGDIWLKSLMIKHELKMLKMSRWCLIFYCKC